MTIDEQAGLQHDLAADRRTQARACLSGAVLEVIDINTGDCRWQVSPDPEKSEFIYGIFRMLLDDADTRSGALPIAARIVVDLSVDAVVPITPP